MVTIEYNGVTVKVPESWDDITLGVYEQVYGEKPEGARERVAVVAKVCNIDAETLLSWPAEVFNTIVGYILFIYGDNPVPPSAVCTIGGTKYIVPVEDELTLGAWVDADEAQKERLNPISSILAIVCRPAGEEYDYKKNEARQKLFAAQPMTRILGVMAFFLHCKQTLEAHSRIYASLCQAADRLPRNIGLFQNPGTGIKLSRTWPAIRYYYLTRLLRYRLRKYSRSYSTAGTKRLPKTHNAS